MIEQIHKHLISEMEMASRGTTTFVICSVLFNVLVLAINSAVALGKSGASDIAFFIFMAGSLTITISAMVAISSSEKSCHLYHEALLAIYEDEGVFKYWPAELNTTNQRRNKLFSIAVFTIGSIAIVIPLLIGGL
ncbi:hypothetical protein [Aurantivibrio infirmus]